MAWLAWNCTQQSLRSSFRFHVVQQTVRCCKCIKAFYRIWINLRVWVLWLWEPKCAIKLSGANRVHDPLNFREVGTDALLVSLACVAVIVLFSAVTSNLWNTCKCWNVYRYILKVDILGHHNVIYLTLIEVLAITKRLAANETSGTPPLPG